MLVMNSSAPTHDQEWMTAWNMMCEHQEYFFLIHEFWIVLQQQKCVCNAKKTYCCGYLPWSLSSPAEHMDIAQRGWWPDPHGLPSSLWLLPAPIFLTCCKCCCLLLAGIILKLQNTSENDPWHQLFCLAAVPLQMLTQWYHNKGVSPKEKIFFTLNCWTGFTVIPGFLDSCL